MDGVCIFTARGFDQILVFNAVSTDFLSEHEDEAFLLDWNVLYWGRLYRNFFRHGFSLCANPKSLERELAWPLWATKRPPICFWSDQRGQRHLYSCRTNPLCLEPEHEIASQVESIVDI